MTLPSETPQASAPQPVVVVACRVLQDLLESLLPEGLGAHLNWMDYGLHRVPGQMTGALQAVIDAIDRPSLVVLGYGLCGNGLKGLQARQHTLLAPRTDDCIAIFLGSYRAYMREFQSTPGTIYLTKGWLESGSNPLQEYEALVVKYGAKEADWLIDQQYRNYSRLALVAHSQADLEHYRPQAQAVAKFAQRWGWRYQEILGSDNYVRHLVEATVALSGGQKMPAALNADFVVVPPGGEIEQLSFIR